MSADRLKELREQEDVRQILFLAESYLGTTLSRTVTDELLYIYEELHFSVDLFDYLIEYCVSKGSKDIHYIKKVAFSWHEAGIDTVTRAKQETTTYHRNYFSILKAFGISNRNPIQSEIHMIDHWIERLRIYYGHPHGSLFPYSSIHRESQFPLCGQDSFRLEG